MSGLVRAELTARRRMLTAVALGAATFLVIMAASYRSLGLGLMQDLVGKGSAPRFFDALTGGSSTDLLTPHGWLGFGFTHPLFLVLSLSVVLSIGAGAVAGQVESGRAELLLARPLRASRLVWTGLAAGVLAEAAVLLGGLAGALGGGVLSSDIRHAGLAPLILAPLQFVPLAVFALCAALLCSALARTRGRALGAATGLLVIAYLAKFTAGLIDGLGWLAHLSPFDAYDPVGAIEHGPRWGEAGALLAVSALLLALAVRAADRRDLA